MDDATAAAKQNWDVASAGWARNADLVIRTSSTVSTWLVEHLDPQPGETFLELAAGPGDTGFAIARRIAPDGHLISTDIAPGMVAAAQRRAEATGVTNVEFREMDALRIDLADASLDGVVHKFGPMLLPDPALAAREARRVLRDGGRYAAASWGALDRNPAIPVMARAMAQLEVIPAPTPGDDGTGPGGMASMSDPAKVRALLTGAGFTDITIEEVAVPFHFRGFDELWKFPTELAAYGQLIKAMSDDDRTRVMDAIRAATEPFLEDGEYRFPAVAVCFFAR